MFDDPKDTFQFTYGRARQVVSDRVLPRNLHRQPGPPPDLRRLSGERGPIRQWHGALDAFRGAVKETMRQTGIDEGGVLLLAAADNIPAGPSSHKRSYPVQTRAAALKFYRHLYLEVARGEQVVWVYSPPRKFRKQVFDELEGLGGNELHARLGWVDEIFSASDRRMLAEAAQLALAWSLKVVAMLGKPEPLTKTKLDFWFATDGTDARTKERYARILLDGFKRIAAVLGSNLLIFSDSPTDRPGEAGFFENDDFAVVVPQMETMHVIYVKGSTIAAGRAGQSARHAMTVIHELSHYREAPEDTETHKFVAPRGGKMKPAQAIENADTWSWFAADLCGGVSVAEKFEAAFGS